MVERINKLIKEVQSSFGLVSGSQRQLSLSIAGLTHAKLD